MVGSELIVTTHNKGFVIMTKLMIKMAQMAAEDEMLYASTIQHYALNEGISWEEVAAYLQIDMAQLAKLALCRLPQESMVTGEIMQVANYVDMERSVLKEFLDKVEGRQPASEPKTQKAPAPKNYQSIFALIHIKRGVMAMFSNRRIWAVGAAVMVLLIGAFVLAQPDDAAATFVVSSGEATIVQADTGLLASSRREIVAAAGEVLTVGTGDMITLSANSTGQIRLLDGSTVELAANTSIDVTELVITDDSYRVRLRMLAGRTVSRVVHVANNSL
jgi:hypothetical protein